jgi:hypothetical protein
MIELLKKLVEQGLPTMLAVLGAVALAFGFYDIQFSPFTMVRRPHTLLIVIAIILLCVAVGLWLLERDKKIAAERYLDGHYNLIRFLVSFVDAHDHRMPEALSEVLVDDSSQSAGVHQASRYAAMYLNLLGFLTPNMSGSEYIASVKAATLVRSNDFRARNADAFRKNRD